MNDYVVLIENYVLENWSLGKTTLEIKEELTLKKWPNEMVEVVIDRLVKQKVEKKSGKIEDKGGPDFWSAPTWPIVKSWASNNSKKKFKNRPVESIKTNPDLIVRQTGQSINVSSPIKKEVSIKKINQEILVQKIEAKNAANSHQLTEKLASLKTSETLDAKIQNQAILILASFVIIILIALSWRFFVIK